jgi:hypothetical protein
MLVVLRWGWGDGVTFEKWAGAILVIIGLIAVAYYVVESNAVKDAWQFSSALVFGVLAVATGAYYLKRS